MRGVSAEATATTSWETGERQQEAVSAPEPAQRSVPGALDLDSPIVTMIYRVYCDMGQCGLGSRWLDLVPGEEAVHKELFARTLKGASEARLKQAISLLRRWSAWLLRKREEGGPDCLAANTSGFMPDPILLGSFLIEVASGGPTAAAGAWAHLEWWRTAVGMPMPTLAPLIESFKWVSTGHFARSPLELPLWAFLNLVRLAVADRGATSVFAAMVLLLTVGCIRWEHQLRSRIVMADAAGLRGHCAVGKARRGGGRPGFTFRAPRCLENGKDTLGVLVPFYQELYRRAPCCSMLVPDLILEDNRLQPHCEWKTTKMRGGKFLELLRGLLVLVGMNMQVAETTSFKTLRRFLATLAEVLEMSPEEQQSMGNWTEIPKGAAKDKHRAQHPTSRIYAGDKEATAATNKHKAVIAVHIVAEKLAKKCPAKTPKAGTWWDPDSIDWATMRAARPSMEAAAKLASRGGPWSAACQTVTLNGAEEWLTRCGAPTSQRPPAMATEIEWSDSNETERASVQADQEEEQRASEEEQEEDPEEETFSCPPAFKQRMNRPAHLQAFEMEGRPIPFCREVPFKAKPWMEDVAYDVVEASGGWCKTCIARMPTQLTRSFRRQATATGGGAG